MQFSSFVTLFFAFVVASVIAKSSEKCRDELAGIVYQPQTQNKVYLEQISKVLIAQKPLLFGDQSQQNQVLSNFVNEFGVTVHVGDAFGAVTLYGPAGGSYPPPPLPKSAGIARAAALNIPAYVVNDGVAYYDFILFDQVAQMKYFTISMPLTNLLK